MAVRWARACSRPAARPPDLQRLPTRPWRRPRQRGLAVLPVVQVDARLGGAAPGDTASPPRDPATFGRFLAALVARYGPQGSLWAERPELPRVPIRAWQVWNEPNITRYWSQQPFAKSYVRLLRAAHARAARAPIPARPSCSPGCRTRAGRRCARSTRPAGAAHFDAVALHPYTRKPGRRAAAHPLRAPRDAQARRRRGAGLGHRAVVARGEGQGPAAGRLRDRARRARHGGSARRWRCSRRARKRRRIARVFWYTWLSTEAGPSAFDWSGLRRLRDGAAVDAPGARGVPALGAQARGLRQGGDARRCA